MFVFYKVCAHVPDAMCVWGRVCLSLQYASLCMSTDLRLPIPTQQWPCWLASEPDAGVCSPATSLAARLKRSKNWLTMWTFLTPVLNHGAQCRSDKFSHTCSMLLFFSNTWKKILSSLWCKTERAADSHIWDTGNKEHLTLFICEGPVQRHLWSLCWRWGGRGGSALSASLALAVLSSQTPHSQHQCRRNSKFTPLIPKLTVQPDISCFIFRSKSTCVIKVANILLVGRRHNAKIKILIIIK